MLRSQALLNYLFLILLVQQMKPFLHPADLATRDAGICTNAEPVCARFGELDLEFRNLDFHDVQLLV